MTERSLGKSGGESRELIMEMAQTLLAVIEEKDPHLRQHCERVANTSAHFCEKFSILPPKDIDAVYFAALLHDLGLIFGPSELSPTSEDLNAEGQAALEAHPGLAEKLLSHLSLVSKCLPIIRHHHEAWDGSGYPDRKKGENIPLGARLIALFDRFDWLTSPRFPRQGVDTMTALEEIIQLSGKAFDGTLVDQFAQFIESTNGVSMEYMQSKKKETVNVKEVFATILQKFTSGKIVPPVMPQVVQNLQNVVDKPNATADILAAVIEREPVISLRLISISNSPVYRGMKEIRTVREAIPRLGIKETMSVVLAIAHKSLYESTNPRYRLLMDRLWGHSIATAFAARLIGQQLGLGDVDLFFLMGLTHDIGKIFLLKALSEEPVVTGLDMKSVIASIQETHLSISHIMLKRWGFNDAFIRAVSLHEKNEFDSGVSKDCLVVNLANMTTRLIGYSSMEASKIEPAELRSASLLGMAPETVVKVGEETKGLVKELAHLF
ncbi:MAG: HDOD domain-containing protein [Syntrophobacterales bacterium]|nr:MAG: HDOD domain-containing protein [Syntrophobacterales bacterium]